MMIPSDCRYFTFLHELRMIEVTREKNSNIRHGQAEEEKVRRRSHAFRPGICNIISNLYHTNMGGHKF